MRKGLLSSFHFNIYVGHNAWKREKRYKGEKGKNVTAIIHMPKEYVSRLSNVNKHRVCF